ncbi:MULTISPECIES: hypothetical protein [Bacillus amyloliquefaciens group]|uniref:hypothetical protein n=1 Tax=Bacillus amyloliquefaciens group TaxID=1938374 RepID=UPI00076BB96A|nr:MULTISPECIES: hypothetical protein [Bacillus amyloliquefaciens group]APA05053.1 hypothetical protein BK055_21010 [Bacillus velezensis]ODB74133.1 hypothetical protein A7310_17920 [Bacillus velezensis]
MTVIKVNLEETVQEFEIGGKVYRLAYDDESLGRYLRRMRAFYRSSVDATNKKFDEMTEAEQDEMTAKALKEAEEIMDTFFGQGSFHPIYEACGKSMRNLYNVIEAVGEFLEDKASKVKAEKRASYVNRK